MSLLTTGTGHPVMPVSIGRALIEGRWRKERFLATLDTSVLLQSINVPRHHWMALDADWLHYRRKQKRQYMASRENTLSFPVPKLGVKTRPC